MKEGILDPGSRPVSRGLAGMTNYDAATRGGKITAGRTYLGAPSDVE